MVSLLTAPRPLLTSVETARRARSVKLVLTDCDGVLTDGGVYYSELGEIARRFSLRDGMGVELLRTAGIATAIVSGEASAGIALRAQKLRLPHVFLGVQDKAGQLARILDTAGVAADEIAFIGDDVNDAGLLRLVASHGLTAAPADAVPAVASLVHYHCATAGGRGAFREFADWILEARGEVA
jgi:3-deoxy-D-manno-octulosonate 8-phosphate phosphatase (KDO 8-P phosphatase)